MSIAILELQDQIGSRPICGIVRVFLRVLLGRCPYPKQLSLLRYDEEAAKTFTRENCFASSCCDLNMQIFRMTP